MARSGGSQTGGPSTGDEEARLQQSLMALEMQKSYITSMSRQLEMLASAETDMLRARETLESYGKTGEGTDLMFPVGGGVYVHAKAADTGNAVVGIGSGVSIEEDTGAALERISRQLENIHNEKQELEENLASISQQYEDLSRKVKAEYYQTMESSQQ